MTDGPATDALAERLRAATLACDRRLDRRPLSPAETFDALAAACRELGIEEWDAYGERGPVARLETEVAGLLGRDAAAFFPSGVMAQQVALRIHADRAGTRRVAMPDLSHLLVHEEDGPRILQDLQVEHLTRGRVPATREHLDAIPGRLAAVLVELPLRDAGCLLPTYDELAGLSAACRERGIALHVDGARIWESQPWFEKGLAELAALADTVYVSFYKGLGGLAGAALVGDDDVIDEARLWRRRMGGTIFRTTPEAVAALVGLRDRLPLMPDLVAWARALAEALPASLVTQPAVPQTNTFLLYGAGDADTVNERLAGFMEEHGVAISRPWSPSDEPGRIVTELAIGEEALELDPATVAAQIAAIVEGSAPESPGVVRQPERAARRVEMTEQREGDPA